MLSAAETRSAECQERGGSGPPPLPSGFGPPPTEPFAFEPPRPQVSTTEVPPTLEEEEPRAWLDLSTVSSSLLSAVVHLGLLLALAVYALEPEIRHEYSLTAAMTEDTGEEEIEQISFEMPPQPQEKLAAPQPVPRENIFGQDIGGPDASLGAVSRDLVGELNEGAFGIGGVATGVGEGGGDGTSFFGIQAQGKRFVYVVDASTSMKGPRFSKAARELLRSVENLDGKQHFYVIFFSDRDYPLFAPRPADDLVEASRRNKLRFSRWMRTIKLVPQTNARPAVLTALRLKPDAVFLLTDGEFSDDTEDVLMELTKSQVPIHTICFESSDGEPSLMRIAEQFHGTYRFVP